MQILYETPLSCEQYVTQKDWLNATLSHQGKFILFLDVLIHRNFKNFFSTARFDPLFCVEIRSFRCGQAAFFIHSTAWTKLKTHSIVPTERRHRFENPFVLWLCLRLPATISISVALTSLWFSCSGCSHANIYPTLRSNETWSDRIQSRKFGILDIKFVQNLLASRKISLSVDWITLQRLAWETPAAFSR